MTKSFATILSLSLLSVSSMASAFECESLGVEPAVCAKAKACESQTNCQADAATIFNAGKSSLNGENGVRIDVVSGTVMLKIAAKNGNEQAKKALPDAYNKVGNAYFFGERVMADTNKAVEWYKKAALADHGDAAYNLGCMYAWGEGVPEDKAEAKKWLDIATKAGNTAASHVLKTL